MSYSVVASCRVTSCCICSIMSCNAMAFNITLLLAIVAKLMGVLQRHGLWRYIADFRPSVDFCSQTSVRHSFIHSIPFRAPTFF
jgi:hypothetical protein